MTTAPASNVLDEFDWPTEEALGAYAPCKDLHEFLEWLGLVGEIGDLRIQRVHNLHIEWCCLFNWRPLTCKALSHALNKMDVSKSRPRAPRTQSGVPRRRPTYYRIEPRHGSRAQLHLAA